MGKKKKPDEERVLLTIRVTPSERDLVNERARMSGQSQNRYMRVALHLGEEPNEQFAAMCLAELRIKPSCERSRQLNAERGCER